MLNNKHLLILMVCIFSFGEMYANQDVKPINAKLTHATVYFKGAELKHEASVNLVKGTNEVVISNLSPQIDINSLKLKIGNGAVISASEYSLDYMGNLTPSVAEKRLKDSVDFYQNIIYDCDISIQTNTDLLELLKANKSIGGSESGLSVLELSKMVDYYGAKSNELNKTQIDLAKKKQKAVENHTRVKKQLSLEANQNRKAVGILKLHINALGIIKSNLDISYYTQHASWTPYYDINVKGIGEQIELASKAKVVQVTGLDWNRVGLTLSTSAPSVSKVAPLFTAWFLDYAYQAPDLSRRMVSQASYREIPQASMIKGQMDSELVEDYKEITMDDFVVRSENELDISYEIDLPYSIEGNGKTQNIDLKTDRVAAEFTYYSVPKMDTETFLIAEVSDWQKLNLLSGEANINFDGNYVGKNFIDVSGTSDKLTLTLGTDSRVTVKRENMRDYSSKTGNVFGKDKKQEFSYRSTVRNNQNKTIKMVLKDQYPLSKQKDIEIEVLEGTTKASYKKEELGVMVWEFELKPGASKEFFLNYSVKYPKDKNVSIY